MCVCVWNRIVLFITVFHIRQIISKSFPQGNMPMRRRVVASAHPNTLTHADNILPFRKRIQSHFSHQFRFQIETMSVHKPMILFVQQPNETKGKRSVVNYDASEFGCLFHSKYIETVESVQLKSEMFRLHVIRFHMKLTNWQKNKRKRNQMNRHY